MLEFSELHCPSGQQQGLRRTLQAALSWVLWALSAAMSLVCLDCINSLEDVSLTADT